jgi:hypothetical protein
LRKQRPFGFCTCLLYQSNPFAGSAQSLQQRGHGSAGLGAS